MILFAFGPLLHIWGHALPVVLPWLFLVKVPFVANVRNPGRFMVMAYVFLAIISGLSLDHYLRRHQQSSKAKLIVWGLAVLIFADFYCAPLTSTPITSPAVYQHLASESEPYGILDLPGGPQSNKFHYMVYSIFHGRPIVQGELPRKAGKSLKDRLEYRNLAKQKQQLLASRVKYVVIHKQFVREYDYKRKYDEPNVEDLEAYAQTYRKVYEDGEQSAAAGVLARRAARHGEGWCERGGSNPQGLGPLDPKSSASTSSATLAGGPRPRRPQLYDMGAGASTSLFGEMAGRASHGLAGRPGRRRLLAVSCPS